MKNLLRMITHKYVQWVWGLLLIYYIFELMKMGSAVYIICDLNKCSPNYRQMSSSLFALALHTINFGIKCVFFHLFSPKKTMALINQYLNKGE